MTVLEIKVGDVTYTKRESGWSAIDDGGCLMALTTRQIVLLEEIVRLRAQLAEAKAGYE